MKIPRRSIFFVRHGERADHIDVNWKKNTKRWDDPPLSPRGHLQARETGICLAREAIDVILVSPFTRTIETAAGIVSAWKGPLPRICVEPGFGESLNACQDPPGSLTMHEIRTILKVDESYEPVFTVLPEENGTDAGCADRVGKTLRVTMERFANANMLIISHASPIASCHLELKKTWRYVGLCTIGKIVQAGPEFSCPYYGSKEHLTAKENLHDVQTPSKAPTHLPIYRQTTAT